MKSHASVDISVLLTIKDIHYSRWAFSKEGFMGFLKGPNALRHIEKWKEQVNGTQRKYLYKELKSVATCNFKWMISTLHTLMV